ncbi:MAG: type II toxin-antitoxin system HipA family toxin [Gammaproteobacteria bacterium]
MTTASVELWGRRIGAVTWVPERSVGVFQYTPEFGASGIEVSPLEMPWREAPYEFPALSPATFKGLPGMLADSLPDKFGNALINVWLAETNRTESSFNPVERLCYTGVRGMGALEYRPALTDAPHKSRALEIERLVALSNSVLNRQQSLSGALLGDDDASDIEDILRVGTSAGGARAKAIVAWNKRTGDFRSGQLETPAGFTHWLIKFDGVDKNSDKEVADPQGFGRIEYAYYLMARAAGITMMPCRLHEEGGRAHFMTRRFDRMEDGSKLHYQSLCAMRHFDFNLAGAYAYEQAIQTIKMMGLPAIDLEQQVRRAVFNVIARNQDDHVKNIGFVMNQQGEWRLSPAFDVAYSYNPNGAWTSTHQMSLNGKRDGFELDDLVRFAAQAGLKRRKALVLVREVVEVIADWAAYADEAGVSQAHSDQIGQRLRVRQIHSELLAI